MKVAIAKQLFGTGKNIIIDDDENLIISADNIPEDAYVFTGDVKFDCDHCFDTLMKLNHVGVNTIPDEKWSKPMQTLMTSMQIDERIPWAKCMPQDDFRLHLKNVVSALKETITNIDENYYRSTWVPGMTILRQLKPASIDEELFDAAMSNSKKTNRNVISTFMPVNGGFAMPISYDRFGAVTGRLTVSQGPNIHTLSKQYRNVITSQWKGGHILQFDFMALEARIALYESNRTCAEDDLYNDIAVQFMGVTRQQVKGAIISELYGVGRKKLGDVIGLRGVNLEKFVRKIHNYFGIDEFKKRLVQQFSEYGYIKNHYGRIVKLQSENPERLLLNYYVQSTGSDVSLMGFGNIVNAMHHDEVKFRPLFLIHDALIVDVHPDSVGRVKKYCNVHVPGYVQRFPLKISNFSNT